MQEQQLMYFRTNLFGVCILGATVISLHQTQQRFSLPLSLGFFSWLEVNY